MIANKLFCIGLFNLLSCFPSGSQSGTVSPNNPNIPTFCIEKVSKEVFVSAKKIYVEKLLKDTSSHKKQNGQFKLTLTSSAGAYKTFQDSIAGAEDENRKEFRYLGQFKEIDFYIVSVTYWEHSEILLIDKMSGNNYSTWSVPGLSPDNKRMAAILPFGLEGEPIGIQILSINRANLTQIEKLIEIDQKLWEPKDFVWENNHSILLKVTELIKPFKGNENKRDNVFSYLRLRIN
ncbi:MAG: hypothetical protein H7296_02555 [Bacteroidia bacterium]|nr:hypothetical protein [Bacteroidia bacterium]